MWSSIDGLISIVSNRIVNMLFISVVVQHVNKNIGTAVPWNLLFISAE